jgi:DNA-directed RNA polymerase subunit alpha
MDAAFSPIQRVAYHVENARLGKITDYERLILEIWTNGALSARGSADPRHPLHAGPLRLPRPDGPIEDEEEVDSGQPGLPPGEPREDARGGPACLPGRSTR